LDNTLIRLLNKSISCVFNPSFAPTVS